MQAPVFTGYQFTNQKLGWQEAIRLCGEPLVKAELISTLYIDAIIEETTATGPYYIISPGFALAHARPEQGVLTTETSLSLLRFAHPVIFNNGLPVSLMIILAAGNGHQHTEAISQLLTWLDNGKLEQILQVRNQEKLDELSGLTN